MSIISDPVIHTGDCRQHMREVIPAGSVHCVTTSPPYWGLRDYGIDGVDWADGWHGVFGLEPSIEMYVAHTLEIFEGLHRVLRDDGVIWWNIGDSYSSGGRTSYDNITANKGNKAIHGSQRPPGDLPDGNKCLIPYRVAIALQEAGWIVRQDVIWRKLSPMPESVNGVRWERCRVKVEAAARPRQCFHHSDGREVSVPVDQQPQTKWTDCPGCPKCEANGGLVLRRGNWRPTTGHESIFMITKGMEYFCDSVAAAEPSTGNAHSRGKGTHPKSSDAVAGREKQNGSFSAAIRHTVETRNPRSVWTFSNEPYGGAHFAAYPSALVQKCLSASISPGGCCATCGAQYAPVIEKSRVATRPGNNVKVWKHDNADELTQRSDLSPNRDPKRHIQITKASEYRPTCDCHAGEQVPATVYDPFCGSGTTLQVAHWLGLRGIGSEIAEHYLPLIRERVETRPRCLEPVEEPDRAPLPGQMSLFGDELESL